MPVQKAQPSGTPDTGFRFGRILFRVAGIYGILILAPQYFLESRIGRDFPPAITHPENYYGFIGAALAWQILYLLISGDPKRYRPVMIIGAFSKLSFVAACIVLYLQGRLAALILMFSGLDFILAMLFIICYQITNPQKNIE